MWFKTIYINKKYKGKILVAEDNANNQLLMEIILNDLGLDVTIVENGKVAFEKYKENLYDLIFMDINMPIMDGIETLKEIKKYEKEHQKIHTPIIALTANAIQTDKEKYIEDGMDGYLSKPIVNAELIKLLDLYLDKN
ncbi:MAG: response regulator [Erysipelotrichia bacterium]|nr:response regulator [Erysipelotrichia bacterium]